MVMDPRIRAGIFAGESGGDYNTLYGYRNRAEGAPQVTNMTVGEVVDFTMPGSEYAQSVRDELGYTATPVGAYQVVGKTLRGAVQALGLDPNAPFDEATQDRIGQWILENQGTGAWKGYKGPMDAEKHLQSFDNAVLSSQNRAPLMMAEPELSGYDKTRGALSNIGDRLVAYGRGTDLPRQLRGDALMAQQRAKQGRNQTAQMLHQQGHTDLANAVLSGQMTGGDAIKTVYAQRADSGSWTSAGDGWLVNSSTGETRRVDPNADPDAAPLLKPEDQFRFTRDLRGDAIKFSDAYRTVKTNTDIVLNSKDSDTQIDDRALVTAFSKVLDPTSVVMPAEAQAIAQSQGASDMIEGAVASLDGGGSLRPETRQRMVEIVEKVSEIQRKYVEDQFGRIEGQASQFGLPVDQILPEWYLTPPTPAPATSSAVGGDGGGGGGRPKPGT